MTSASSSPLRVVIVEDTRVVREFLHFILDRDPGLQVVGTAKTGEEAVDLVARLQPDVVTMDVNMPGIDGFVATRRIMETCPTPIVIVSGSVDPKEVQTTFRAMEAGALAVLPRPEALGHPAFERIAREFVQAVKAMAEVQVVRRWAPTTLRRPQPRTPFPRRVAVEVIVIGASTGGPTALAGVLENLPRPIPVPVLVVQHMASGFMHGFVNWLTTVTRQPVRLAVDGDQLVAGQVLVAPDGAHLSLSPQRRLRLEETPPVHGMRPAVSYLMDSVTAVYGERAAGVLLSGMGCDGADALLRLRQRGGFTIVQDQASSAVFGMGGEAVRLGAASHQLPPVEIAFFLTRLLLRTD